MKRKASAELNNGVPMTAIAETRPAESSLANTDNYHNLPVSAASPDVQPSSYHTLGLSNGDDASVVGAPLYQSVPRDGGFASNSDASNYQNLPAVGVYTPMGAPVPHTGSYQSPSVADSYQSLPQAESYRPLDTVQTDDSYRPLGEF